METGKTKFQTGQIIKGRDLKEYSLCIVLPEDMNMQGFQYQLGVNEDVNSPFISEKCRKGFTFLDVQGVLQYLHHGTKLAVIAIPANNDVYVDDKKFRTHKLTIKKVMHLKDVATWKYLHKQGVDITVNDNFAVKVATQQGRLEIIKYLHENGADITVNNNSAIKWASCLGYEDIVKYLYEHGADLTKSDSIAV